jgi:hypothetical protein
LDLAASIVLKSEWQFIAKDDVATKSPSTRFDSQIGSDALGAPSGVDRFARSLRTQGWIHVVEAARSIAVARRSGLEKPSIKIGKSSRGEVMINAARHERKGFV